MSEAIRNCPIRVTCINTEDIRNLLQNRKEIERDLLVTSQKKTNGRQGPSFEVQFYFLCPFAILYLI